MNILDIVNKIKNREPKPIGTTNKYAVLIPLIDINDNWEVIFEVRAKELKSQPGEISFPGGKVELGETYEEAAIRETIEELRIDNHNIDVVGELDYLVSYENLVIHCFLATINHISIDKIDPNPDEVDHIFTVPLDYFLNNEPDIYELGLETVENDEFPYNLIPGGKKYKWRRGKHRVLFYQYNDYIIWGFTARMMHHFIEIIKDLD